MFFRTRHNHRRQKKVTRANQLRAAATASLASSVCSGVSDCIRDGYLVTGRKLTFGEVIRQIIGCAPILGRRKRAIDEFQKAFMIADMINHRPGTRL